MNPDNPTTALVKTSQSPVLARVSSQLALTDKLLTKPEEPFLIPYRKGNKWGFCDRNKNIVIDCVYDWAEPFVESLARVRVDGRFSSVSFGKTYMMPGSRYGFIDLKGEQVIPLIYQQLGLFSQGLSSFSLNTDHKWGYVNKNGEQVIETEYDDAGSFSDGIAWAEYKNFRIALDVDGDELFYLGPSIWTESFKEDMSVVRNSLRIDRKQKRGFVDKNGKIVIPFKYNEADSFLNGLARVRLNNKYGFVDKLDNHVIPVKYDWISTFSDNLYVGSYNRQVCCVDKDGNRVASFPININYACDLSDGLSLTRMGDKYGYIDINGHQVIENQYDSSYNFSEGLACNEVQKRYGFIDKMNRQVIPVKYDNPWENNIYDTLYANHSLKYLYIFNQGIAGVLSDNKFGFIGKDGKEYWED